MAKIIIEQGIMLIVFGFVSGLLIGALGAIVFMLKAR